MNILYVSHEINLGGATRSLLALIDIMVDKGHNIFVLIPKNNGEFYEELKERDVTIIKSYYSWWTTSSNFFSKFKSFIKYTLTKLSNIYLLKKKITKHNIDIIHTNSLVVNIGIKISEILKVPHIWHIREFGEEDHGMKYLFNKKSSLDLINKNSNKIILISKAIHQKYINYFDEKKVKIIYNGISNEYLHKKHHKNKNKLNLLISGSLQNGKGQKEAIKAVNYLIKNGKNNLKLWIAGRGNSQYKKELMNLIQEMNIEQYVELLGYINDMVELRKKMNIELVCSKKEAFGRVTIEAMMSSNPVIASNTGANIELVENKFNGLLYEQGNFTDLANKINYFVEDFNEINRIGKNAFEFSKNNFTAQINADKIEKIYEDILK